MLGFFGDLIALPFEVAGDVAGITPMVRAMNDDESDCPFGTFDRLASLAENFDEIFEEED